MIQSIHKGRGFRGVLNYVMGAEKSAELVGGNMYGTDPRSLASEFKQWRELRPGLGKAVFHSSLSLPYGQGGREELGGAQWQEVAQRYLEHLGYGRSPFVVVRHRDTEHDHVHIIAARIDADGRSVSDSNDYRRGEEVLREIEMDYGLTPVPSAREVDRSAMRPGEIRQLEKSGEVSTRLRLQDLLDRAAAGKPSMSHFIRQLQDVGVEVVPRVARTGHVSGISYRLDGVSFRGSSLGRLYSWKGLQERLGVDYQPERDLPAVRRAASRGTPEPVVSGSSGWSRESLEALRRELSSLSPKDQGIGARPAGEARSRSEGGTLSVPTSALSLVYRLRSGRSATRLAVSRLPGASVTTPLLDASRAVRSPIGLLLYGTRLATAAGRVAVGSLADRRPTAGSRRLVTAYLRAAATDRPPMTMLLDRLRSAGIEPLPLVDRRGAVRAIAYRVGEEVVSGQELGASYTWKGLQRQLGVSYEPERDLPRISTSGEREVADVSRGETGTATGRGSSVAGRTPRDQGWTPQAGEAIERSHSTAGSAPSNSGRQSQSRKSADLGPTGCVPGPSVDGGTEAGLRAEVRQEGRSTPRPAHASDSLNHGRGGEVRGPQRPVGGVNSTDRRDRLREATLRASLERSGVSSLDSYHTRKAYAGSLARADAAWATAALRGGAKPHQVLSEVARRGAKAWASPEVRIAHGTRVLARALATVKPARSVEKTVSMAAQALAIVIKAPIAAVKALLIIRNIARELSQERGR